MESSRLPMYRRRLPYVIGGVFLVAIILAGLFTPLGHMVSWPPALWLGSTLNRREFNDRRQDYEGMVRTIAADLEPLKPGSVREYEFDEVLRGSLKRLGPHTPPPLPNDNEGTVVEERPGRHIRAQKLEKGFVIRFITRIVPGAGTYSLIRWEPAPVPSAVWWSQNWWQNDTVQILDGQWWNAYYP